MRRAIALIAIFVGLDYVVTAFFIHTKDWFYETNPLLSELFASAGLTLGVIIAFVATLSVKTGVLYGVYQLLAMRVSTDTQIFSRVVAAGTFILSVNHVYAIGYNLILGLYRHQLPNPYTSDVPIFI